MSMRTARKIPEPVISRVNVAWERWYLEKDYSIVLPVVHRELRIAAGFTWDGGSLPRVFWRISHPQEFPASYLIHDALYSSHLLSRMQADRVLRECIRRECGSLIQRELIYRAVRLFGGAAWDGHKQPDILRARRLIKLD